MLGPVSMPELLVILVIVLIIFGAGKISEIGGALGKGISEFRRNSDTSADSKPAPVAKDESSSTAEA